MVVGAVLAAGLGTRMRPLTYVFPKPLLALGTKPVLQHILEWFRDNGIKDVVVVTCHMHKLIELYFGDGSDLGINIKYVRADRPLGTGGQLSYLKGIINETFVLTYSDVVTDVKISDVLEYHRRVGSICTIVLVKYRHRIPYGILETENGRVTKWVEKPELTVDVISGIFVMEPEIFKYVKKEAEGLNYVIERAIEAGEPVYAYVAENAKFLDLGNMESYEKAYEEIVRSYGRI